jgi:hypothetical protein
MPAVNGVGEPCAGEPHARFEAAGAGNGAPGHGHAVKRPAGETRGKVAAGPDAGQMPPRQLPTLHSPDFQQNLLTNRRITGTERTGFYPETGPIGFLR